MFFGINREKVENLISNFDKNPLDHHSDIIASLTSFKERIYDVHFAIYSIFKQSIKPNKIILWLAKNEFPNKFDDLPKILLKFVDIGLSIEWIDNFKSYKKLLPALSLYKDKIIITFDDDIYYHKDSIKNLYISYLKEPNYLHCHRAHQITFVNNKIAPYNNWIKCIKGEDTSYLNWITGGASALYTINTLNDLVFDYNLAQKLTPSADDIWFWTMALINKTKIRVVKNNFSNIISTNIDRAMGKTNEYKLSNINVLMGKNIEQLNNVINYFDLYKILLNK